MNFGQIIEWISAKVPNDILNDKYKLTFARAVGRGIVLKCRGMQ